MPLPAAFSNSKPKVFSLDPNYPTVANDTIICGHQLECFRNGRGVTDLDGRTFLGDVDNRATRAEPHVGDIGRLADILALRFSSFFHTSTEDFAREGTQALA